LVLALLLLGGSRALAFECDGVKLPSRLVICGDPELMRLADERQAAFNEARARLGEDRFPQLWEDQKAWVRSYATACGVLPDRPAPIPVAIARISYLQGFGFAANDPPQGPIEPEATDRVSLVEANGIYTVPVLINGVLPLQFVLDRGAGDVSIPADVFLTLIRTGTIVKEDYIGKGGYRLADGSSVQSDRFFIRELKGGNKILRHVSAMFHFASPGAIGMMREG
jgi:hypothetical protein